jgi:mxaA protein
MMKKLLLLLLFAAQPVFAADTPSDEPVQDPRVRMTEVNPERSVGYSVGDILSRTITLEVKKPYQLVKTSLPIVGYERRWQGQVTGIELHSISMEQSSGLDATTYVLHLSYQVFTNNVVAKPANLPPEIIKFSGEGKMFQYRIPSWNFRISPLAVYGSVVIEKDMSPLRGLLLLDATPQKQRLTVMLAIFGLSLLGLLYVLGTNTWLPRMGRPFARAYRDLRKLPATDAGLQQAVARIHQALNLTAGSSVFAAEGFVESKPGFAPVQADLEKFFGLSRTVFFEPTAPHGLEQPPLVWLRQFCLACRHCERGLK